VSLVLPSTTQISSSFKRILSLASVGVGGNEIISCTQNLISCSIAYRDVVILFATVMDTFASKISNALVPYGVTVNRLSVVE
tara:strand:+ start:366 stop:611 length:246 start_codon:yes stop_codon:yes gene_type:complete